MRALFWLIALTALAVGVSQLGQLNDGFVLVQMSPWRFELSLNFFIALLLISFFVLYVVVRLLVNALRMPSMVAAYRARKRHENGVLAFGEAVKMLYEGRYSRAIRYAQVAVDGDTLPGLSALVAARAARGLRDDARERAWLDLAQQHDEEVRQARLMTEAELSLKRREFDVAAEMLQGLLKGGPRHAAALRLAMRANLGRKAWTPALQVIRQLEKHRGLTPEQARPLMRSAHLGNIEDRAGDAYMLGEYWRTQMQSKERADPQTALAMVNALIAAGDGAQAQKLIEQALEREWDSELVQCYGQVDTPAAPRLVRAEQWLKEHPQDAGLLFALGKICRQAELWGKAQSYLEASLAKHETRSAHAELAALSEQLERTNEAQKHYREAALLCGWRPDARSLRANNDSRYRG